MKSCALFSEPPASSVVRVLHPLDLLPNVSSSSGPFKFVTAPRVSRPEYSRWERLQTDSSDQLTTEQDVDVMLSDDEPLRPGLSFAFFTPDLDFIPQILLQDNPTKYSDVAKYRFIPHVEALRGELWSVKSLGVVAATEWYKTLASKGKDLQAEANQFEMWDNGGGLQRAKAHLRHHLSGSSVQHPQRSEKVSHLPDRPSLALPLSVSGGTTLRPLGLNTSTLPVMSLPDYGPAPGIDLPSRPPDVRSDATSMGSTHSRPARSRPSNSERHQIRLEKKTQIQKRCRSLHTPIYPDMLQRLNTYKTALELDLPLNETAWQQLQPRLEAEASRLRLEDEARNSARTAPIPGQFRPPQRSDDYVLAHAEMPIKETLCEIAEDYIRQVYSFGSAVVYHTAPQFAADVLLRTREQFLQLQARVRALRHAGLVLHDSFFPIEIESLKLEHMRHVFVQTVQPRTEGLRKDLFMCNDCPPSVTRYFAFEAVVQHYSTSHTSAFQRGQAQVYWKADWPEHPIFKLQPQRVETPEPSLTHTPTLPHQPLVELSQSSYQTAHSLMQDWRTPDAASLVSNTTDASSTGAGLPNRNFYHVQREALSREVSQAWKLVGECQDLPVNLQVFLALSTAVTAFNQTNRNHATLQLFRDCLSHTDALAELRTISRLQCSQCAKVLRRYIAPTFLELINHFQNEHLGHNVHTDKFKWYVDMVELPNRHVIKSLLDNVNLPPSLSDLLMSAHINAVAQPEAMRQYAQPSSTTVALYDGTEARSSGSLTTRVTYIPLHDSGQFPLQDYGGGHISQYDSNVHTDRGPIPRTDSVHRTDTTVWSDTARSATSTVRFSSVPKSRDDGAVDDFLSRIESHVDVEMASSLAPNPVSSRTSRPISSASSIRDQSRDGSGYDSPHSLPSRINIVPAVPAWTTQTDPGHDMMDGPTDKTRQDRIGDPFPSASPTERDYRRTFYPPPRDMIELDEHGNPISSYDTTHYYNPSERYSPYRRQQPPPHPPYHPHHDTDTRYTYRPVRYIPPQSEFSEIHTDEWGRTYIERPAKRQYIELDTSSIDPRPETINSSRPAVTVRPRGSDPATRSSREPG